MLREGQATGIGTVCSKTIALQRLSFWTRISGTTMQSLPHRKCIGILPFSGRHESDRGFDCDLCTGFYGHSGLWGPYFLTL